MATSSGAEPVASSGYAVPKPKNLAEKNAQLAADDATAAQTAAPSSDKVLSGEQGFSEDMAQLRQKAREQGTDQPALRDAADALKKDVIGDNPALASNRAA
ncbi:hypothetical protein COCOBI_07-1980 [Coccomyxa sp. Obi]|nr:hypothetical protein COCOBI_07-1980 [Coccomyxa sp. Obi]